MKGHWIPPSPKGFIDRIAAKLGYSKTIPSGLGTDLVDAVSTLNDQIVDLGEIIYKEESNLDYSSASGKQTMGSITIPPGKWLIFGSVSINVSSAVQLSPDFNGVSIKFPTFSSTVSNGGYITSTAYLDTATTTAISLTEFIYNQSNKYQYRLGAIRLK